LPTCAPRQEGAPRPARSARRARAPARVRHRAARRRLPVRAHRRRAPLLHRQHDHPRPTWRKKDADGALRINPTDAAALGVASGGALRLTTKRDSIVVSVEVSESMQRGHVSLPNGLGLSYEAATTGVATNELTASEDRDPFVGTPWHKYVPARLERV